MRERKHYSKAPIVEAVIDLRATQYKGLTVEELEKIHRLIAEEYPSKEPIYFFAGEVGFDAEAPTSTRSEAKNTHIGFRFASKDKQRVFQSRLDGFTFSNLAPYDRWETFRDEAARLWDIYRSNTKIENITRAAVRYINRLEFPNMYIVRLEQYLRVYPEAPDDWPIPAINGFFMQLQAWQSDLNCMLILNESFSVAARGARPLSVQLDIDLFRDNRRTPWTLDNQGEVWDFLERLHERKNEIFEASITDKTREMIK